MNKLWIKIQELASEVGALAYPDFYQPNLAAVAETSYEETPAMSGEPAFET